MVDLAVQVLAVTLGPSAVRAVQSGADHGRIEAVFPSVFYVKLRRALIAVATQNIAAGPLTITTEATTDWQKFGLVPGKTVHLSKNHLTLPGQLSVDIGAAALWQPARALPANHDLGGMLSRLDATELSPPNDGFGETIKLSNTWPSEVETAWAWTLASLTQHPADARQLDPLLGRGPGLTPAGDDFLGGMMIAFHHLGHKAIAAALWKTLEPRAQSRTNAISGALLNAASEGFGSAPLHHALHALIDPQTKNLTKALATLDQIGHSSGWDAFAGIVLVFRAQAAVADQIAA